MTSHPRLYSSAVETIGDTPLVELSRLTRGRSGRLLAKLEMFSPGSSKKDRIARQIIEEARDSGLLRPGQTVIEQTSGNTGTGAAIVCAVLGHPFIAVMSRGNSAERAMMMRAFGAEVVLVDQEPGGEPGRVTGGDIALAEAYADRLQVEREGFRLDQFFREANTRAHELHTGPEIWQASQGQVTAFCDFVGSGGSFAGLWRSLKSASPAIRGYIVEPAGTPYLATGKAPVPGHAIQGGGYSRDLALLEGITPDGFLTVTEEEAVDAVHRLAREEGIFAGYSSGANVAAALKLLDGPERGGTLAVLLCDTGLKYLSTSLWDGV